MGYKERKEINRRYRQAEKRILELEERQRHLAVTLSDPGNASDYQVLLDATQEAARVADELLMLYEEWEGLTDTIGGMDP